MDNIENLKQHADIQQIIEYLSGKKAKQTGNTLRISPCPLCGHKDCFTIYPKEQIFKCFSAACDKAGDVFKFIGYSQNLPEFKDQLKWLSEYLNIPITIHKKYTNNQQPAASNQQLKQEIWKKSVAYYHNQLFTDQAKPVLEYLTEKRLLSIELIKEMEIGFTTGKLREYLESKGYKLNQLKHTGLVIHHEQFKRWIDQFPYGGIIFPHKFKNNYQHFTYKFNINKKGEFIYKKNGMTEIQLRRQFRDSHWLCYNQDSLIIDEELPDKKIILVEGEFDCLSIIEKAKYKNVIAIMGNSHVDPLLLTDDFNYVLAFDNDKPGEKYKNDYGIKFNLNEIQVQILSYPKKYNDPDEWLSKSTGPTIEFKEIFKNLQRFIPIGEDGIPDPETKIFKQKNCYWLMKTDSETKKDKHIKLTNFTIKFPRQYIYENDKGEQIIEREFILKNELGEVSKPAIINADQIVTIKKFQSWLMERGFFELLQPNDPSLSNLRQYLHKREARKNVNIKTQIGYLEDEDIFLFGNAIVDCTGKIIHADKDGIIWQYNTKGFKPFNPEEGTNTELPIIEEGFTGKEHQKFISEITSLLMQNYGMESIALTIGWFRASLYADIIFKYYHKFPILFVYGPTKSGKNTLIEMLYKLIGQDTANPKVMGDITSNWLYRRMSYFSNLPIWLDEHRRGVKKVEELYSSIRGFYNKIMGKGHAIDASTRTKSYAVRGTLVLSGEALPADDATRNRCLIISINTKNRKDDIYRQVLRLHPKFKLVTYQWIKERMNPEFCKNKMERINQIIYHLRKHNLIGREAENYAIIAAFTEDLFELKDIRKYYIEDFLIKEAREKFIRIEDETIVNQFNNDLSLIYMKKDYLNENYFTTSDDNTILYLWSKGIYEAWYKYRKKELHDYSFNISYNELIDILKDQQYWFGNSERIRFNSPIGRKRAIGLYIENIPEQYYQILENKNFKIDNETQKPLSIF